MSKTKYNEAVMQYAIEYLDRLLDMETVVNRRVERKLDQLAQLLIEKEKQSPGVADASSQSVSQSGSVDTSQREHHDEAQLHPDT